MTSAESSMPDHPPPTPPHLTTYALRWVGKALEIRPHYWHGPLADSQETDADRQTLFSAVRTLQLETPKENEDVR